MPCFALGFLCGILLLQYFSFLPSLGWMFFIGPFFLILVWFCKLPGFLKWVLMGLGSGFLWTIIFVTYHSSWLLPSILEGRDIIITGHVASIPEVSEQQTQFLFALETAAGNKAQGLVRLSWRAAMPIKAGETWKLSVRLKKIHSLSNPGSFDYEAWALLQGIRAQGYVKKGGVKCHGKKFIILQLRQKIYDQLLANLPKTTTSPWIMALALGERHHILPESWQVLRSTGTNHLMAIAGLHIGFMSACVFVLIFQIWKCIPSLVLYLPAQLAAGVVSLGMVIFYSLLAGFSIPTQRACFMFLSFIILFLLRRATFIWHSFSVGLLAVLIVNPLDVLSESFWLSFGSIALIIYGMKGRWMPQGLWWKYGKIQWVIGLGLLPFSIKFFQQFSTVSFIANSIAIPWVTFCILPLTLLGTLCLFITNKLGSVLLLWADQSLQSLWGVLSLLASFNFSTWSHAFPNSMVFILASIGILILLFPAGLPGRGFGVFLLLPLLFFQPTLIKEGEYLFTLLDVGQGLSAVIQTQNHVLIFDAGVKYNDFDLGESVVLPFLRHTGINQIDTLVISHGDNDHSGGVNSLLRGIPVKNIITSVPEKFSFNSSLCLQNQSWQWDGVRFTFLHPSVAMLGLGNNSSCVLKVSNGNYAVLLTGDIEKEAEKALLLTESNNLKADILVAPHHGSKTSGLASFITQVDPTWVLFPVGYKNRYHFPHPSVLKTYSENKVTGYDSANNGAISFFISRETVDLQPMLYRKMQQHYWNNI